MTFKVGDHVVYPSQGAGVVQERTTRVVLGETHEYLKVVFVRGDMEVLVPLKKGEEVGLRHTVDADEIGRLLEAIRQADLTLPNQWPPRFRAEQEILSTGSAYDLARLIGVLAKRDVEKGLAATEREVLENAKTMLASELAVVQDIALEEAEKQLDEAIAFHGT
ncbi:MAG TPA: CarD family transcriptional regulator [Trueperaceae bacterium]|nr:CarD family transcriptional regulator [Trueperaceae bacterium]